MKQKKIAQRMNHVKCSSERTFEFFKKFSSLIQFIARESCKFRSKIRSAYSYIRWLYFQLKIKTKKKKNSSLQFIIIINVITRCNLFDWQTAKLCNRGNYFFFFFVCSFWSCLLIILIETKTPTTRKWLINIKTQLNSMWYCICVTVLLILLKLYSFAFVAASNRFDRFTHKLNSDINVSMELIRVATEEKKT